MTNNNYERWPVRKALVTTFTLSLVCWGVLIAVGEWIAS